MDKKWGRSVPVENVQDALLLFSQSFDDYLAARFLLNNGMIFPGITLANYAVEKALKGLLRFLRVDYKFFHIESKFIDKIPTYFSNTPFRGLLDIMDQGFLRTLVRVFDWRYHDNITEPQSIGFFVNQFIGELDFTCWRLSSLISVKDGMGVDLAYHREASKRNARLIENNFVLLGIDKVAFMQRSSSPFIAYYQPGKKLMINISINVPPPEQMPYNGNMTIIKVEPGDGEGVILIS